MQFLSFREESRLFVLLGAESSVRVGKTDRQLLGALNDFLALLGGHAVSDLSAVDAVLHEQHFQLLDVVDEELLEASGQHMTGTGIRSVTDVGHQVLSLEATTHSVVNTLRLTPVGLEKERSTERRVNKVRTGRGVRLCLACGQNTYGELGISVALVTDEPLRPLLHNRRSVRWADRHFSCIERNINTN